VPQHVRDLTARLRWRVDDQALNRDDRRVANKKRQIAGLQRSAVSAGKALVGMFAARAVIRGATDAAEAAVAFDKTLADIQGLMPGRTQRVLDLGAAMRELSVESGKSATDLSKATFQIISAIGDTADTVDNLRLVTQLAKAGNTDALVATDLLTAVTLAYGDSSLEAQKRVSDLAVTTIRLGKTTLPELNAAVGQVSSSWKSLGGSQEGMFAGFTALAGVTGDTQKASTQLSAAATALLARTPAMEKAFKALGVTSAKALVAKKGGIVPALQAVVATTDGSGESIQKLLGNVRAMRAVMNLTSAGADRFSNALKENAKAAGATERGADAIANGAGKMATGYAKATAKADELQLKIGDRTKGPLLEMKLGVLNLADALSQDLFDAFDVAEGSADKFAESEGFKTIDRVSQAFGLARAVGTIASTTLEGAGLKGAEVAATAPLYRDLLTARLFAQGESKEKGILAAISQIESQSSVAVESARMAGRKKLGFTALQIFEPEQAREAARLARIGKSARAETAELGGTRVERRTKAAVRGDFKAVFNGLTVKMEGNSVETVLKGAEKLGESLGDRVNQFFGNPTEAE